MKVTSKGIGIDDELIKKLDLIINKITKEPISDFVLLIEGIEGAGKSGLAGTIGFYVAEKTGRPFSHENFFFDGESMVEFGKSTWRQIIIADEMSLFALASEWQTNIQRTLIKLLSMCRNRQHLFIFCVQRFDKFSRFLVADRPMGMLHLYSGKKTKDFRWCYIRGKFLQPLLRLWETKHIRAYKKFYSARGRFGYYLPQLIDMEAYERRKDDSIMSIGISDKQKYKKDLHDFKFKLATLNFPVKSRIELAKHLGLSDEAMRLWQKRYENTLDSLEKSPKTSNSTTKHNNINVNQDESEVDADASR